jgi:WD40 repeat protein
MMKELQAVRADFTPDNRLMFYRPDGSVFICNLSASATVREIARLPGSRGWIAVHPSGDRFAVYTDGGLLVCDLTTGAVHSRLTRVASFEAALAWDPSGDFLAIAGADRRVRIWDVNADRELAELSGFSNDGICPVFTAGDLLATSGWEGLIRFWDWRSGKQVLCVPGAFVRPPCYCEDLLVTQLGEENTAVWHVDAAREYRTLTCGPLPGRDLELWSAAFHPLGRILTVATSQGEVLWDLDTGRELCRLPETPVHVLSEPDGALLANCNNGLFRRPIDFRSGPEPRLTLGPAERLDLQGTGRVIDLSRDGRVFGLASPNGAFVQDRQGRVQHLSHSDCRSVSFSPDGRWVATGSHNGCAARIWRMDTGELVKELLPGVGMMGVRFSPAGTWLATTGCGLRLWHVGTWEAGPEIGNCLGIAFSDDESLLALENGSGRVRLLEVSTARDLAELADPAEDRAGWVGFAPDHTRLITATQVGKVFHIWDLRLIRTELAELGLDWDTPAFPAAPHTASTVPIQVTVRSTKQPSPGKKLPPLRSTSP